MKVKELIEYLKELDQEKDIGIEDDGESIHIEEYLDGNKAYVLSGSYSNYISFDNTGKWKELK